MNCNGVHLNLNLRLDDLDFDQVIFGNFFTSCRPKQFYIRVEVFVLVVVVGFLVVVFVLVVVVVFERVVVVELLVVVFVLVEVVVFVLVVVVGFLIVVLVLVQQSPNTRIRLIHKFEKESMLIFQERHLLLPSKHSL